MEANPKNTGVCVKSDTSEVLQVAITTRSDNKVVYMVHLRDVEGNHLKHVAGCTQEDWLFLNYDEEPVKSPIY